MGCKMGLDKKVEFMNDFDSAANLSRSDHDKKVPITDVALTKIGPLKFATTTAEDNFFIRLCTQRVLYLAKERNNSNEVALTFRLNDTSQEIGITYGNDHDVDVEKDSCSYHILNGPETKLDTDFFDCVVVIAHNHPSLGTLSLQDIQFFLDHDKLRILIAVTNAGVCFSLEKLKSYSKREAIKLFNPSIDLFNTANTNKGRLDAAKAFLNNAYSCGINYSVR